tara:strand:+ start:1734 stop:1919 length:186 start_codon:yes stop_codon:yes gene_type:complete
MASAVASVRREKLKVGEIEFVQVLKRVMPTVLGLQVLRNARSHPALMLYPVRSGNVVVRSR